jgi:hypothetical protein
MLPEKVVQVAMAVASPPFSMVAVPEALQAAGEGCQWDDYIEVVVDIP